MRRFVLLSVIVVSCLLGGMTLEAKTAKKKSKARTTQTSSSQWNGDIPSAAILYSMFTNDSKYDKQFKNHGYSIMDFINLTTGEAGQSI